MTSIAAESVSTILVSCKQTRFHIESPNYREVYYDTPRQCTASGDKSANWTSSTLKASTSSSLPARRRARGKERERERERPLQKAPKFSPPLSYASKPEVGMHSWEGTGPASRVSLSQQLFASSSWVDRSFQQLALLRAIAEKLIPGVPEQTRVAILQQTSVEDANTDDIAGGSSAAQDGPSVLEAVVDKATARSELEQEINGKGVLRAKRQSRSQTDHLQRSLAE